MMISRSALAAISILLALPGCAAAQSATTGNTPMSDTFRRIDGNRWYISNGWTNGPHQSCEWRPDALTTTGDGLRLTLSDHGGKIRPIGCGELHTNTRYGYGLYETRMRMAAGSGLNTAFFTYIGDKENPAHDEIDFEFLGKNTHAVQINYYVNGKGGHEVMVPLAFDASKEFHDYAFDWEPAKIAWYIDGKEVHETPPGAVLPSNPGHIFFSLWSGSAMVDGWLGAFTYAQPVTGEVAWVGYTPPGQSCSFPQSMTCK